MTPESPASGAKGIYGLRLPDLPDAGALMVAAPPSWPVWRIRHRTPEAGPPEDRRREILTEDRARLTVSGGGLVELDRASATSTYVLPERPRDLEIVHPFLSLTAATAARWRGWHAFHAGAVLIDGQAWGVLGEKGAGKSSLLASLALDHGAEILTDDVLIMSLDLQAVAGPRCIDLRADSAKRFAVGEPLGVVGARERWRIPLPEGAVEAPLVGWISLGWGADVSLEPLGPADRFRAITANLAIRLLPPDVQPILDLAALPVFRLIRPREYESSGVAGQMLLDTLGDADPAAAASG